MPDAKVILIHFIKGYFVCGAIQILFSCINTILEEFEFEEKFSVLGTLIFTRKSPVLGTLSLTEKFPALGTLGLTKNNPELGTAFEERNTCTVYWEL